MVWKHFANAAESCNVVEVRLAELQSLMVQDTAVKSLKIWPHLSVASSSLSMYQIRNDKDFREL